MDKDTVQNIFIGVLIGLVILMGAGGYYLAQRIESLATVTDRIGRSVIELQTNMQAISRDTARVRDEMNETEQRRAEAAREFILDATHAKRCRDSGGAFGKGCACAEGYALDTLGYCVDTAGLPGGELGMSLQSDQENVLVRAHCEVSGGQFLNGACACPVSYTPDVAGYCVDAAGIPGGVIGAEIRAAYPLP